MTSLETYNNIFIKLFGIEEKQLKELSYQDIKEWDSVGHMELIADLEDAFDIEMEADDIIDFFSYEKGKEILSDKYGVKF